MKQRITMIIFLTFAFVLILAGCKAKTPALTEYNALSGWTTDASDVYTITSNTDSKLAFTYAKGDKPEAYMSKAVDKDLSGLKKLVISVQGTGSILVKLSGGAKTTAKMVSLNVTGIKGSYEWNLSADSEFLKGITKIDIIASPGKEESIGEVEITEMKFYNTVADNYIIQTDFNNIPNNVNEYNGTDTDFHFNSKWANFAEETYTITTSGTNTNVSFVKAAGQEWSTMLTKVQGNFSKFNYVVAVVSGTNNQQLLLKAANGYESRIKFDGTNQEVAVDISAMTTEEKNAITDIFLFGLPGAAGSGSFVIHDIYFTENYTIPAVEIIKNVYNGTDETFSLENWYDFGDLVYTTTKSGTDTILSYQKNTEWALAASHIEGDVSEFGVIEFTITGQTNKTAMFKIEGGGQQIEMNVTFDGTKQVFVMKMNAMLKTSLEAVNKVMIFALPGGTGNGQMTIHSVTFKADEKTVNTGWTGDAIYTIVEDANKVSINYTRLADQGWNFVKAEFSEDLSEYNVLTMVVKGEVGKQIIIKPNDNGAYEKTVTFDGTKQSVSFDLQDPLTKILIFVDPIAASLTGAFEIHSATMSYVQQPIVEPQVDVNNAWVDNGDSVYMITENNNIIKVDYVKIAGQEWATMKQDFGSEFAGYNVFEIHLSGTAGKKVLVKVNNSIEVWVEFDAAGKGMAIVKASAITGVLLFGEGGDVASGTFYIESAFLKLEQSVSEWADNGDSVYTFTNTVDGIKVDYVKTAVQEWSAAKVVFSDDEAMFNTFTIHMTGTAGKKVLVKLNNTVEKWVEFDVDGKGSASAMLDSFSDVLLFAEAGTGGVTGSFVITAAYLSYTAPEMKASLNVNAGYVDGGDAVYTITNHVDGYVNVTYAKPAGKEWANMSLVFAGPQLGYNTYTIHLEGTAGKKVLVKINNSIEKWVEFDAAGKGEARVTAATILSVHLFAEGGDVATGSFKIMSAVLSLELDVNKAWKDNGDGSNTVTKVGSTIVVDYVKLAGQEWTTLLQTFEGDYALFNTFTIHMSGTAGKKVLVKINNAIEQWVEFDAAGHGSAVVTAATINSVHLFAEAGDAPATGQYTILSASLSLVVPEVLADKDVNSNWVDSGDAVYTFTNVGSSVKVDYTKIAGQEWATMKQEFTGASGYTKFEITMTGVAGKKVLVKLNNSIEQWVEFNASGNGSATITAGATVSVYIFAEGGDVATGSFTIVSATLKQA